MFTVSRMKSQWILIFDPPLMVMTIQLMDWCSNHIFNWLHVEISSDSLNICWLSEREKNIFTYKIVSSCLNQFFYLKFYFNECSDSQFKIWIVLDNKCIVCWSMSIISWHCVVAVWYLIHCWVNSGPSTKECQKLTCFIEIKVKL